MSSPYTQIPNWFIENHLPHISSSACSVFLVICRQTIGWHRTTDAISMSQLIAKTGLSRNTCRAALHELLDRKLIRYDRHLIGDTITTIYEVLPPVNEKIVPKDDFLVEQLPITQLPTRGATADEGVNNSPSPGVDIAPVQGEIFTPQKKGNKKINKEGSTPSLLTAMPLQVYREICRLNIPIAYRDITIATVTDEELWRSVLLGWIGRGYRPNAIAGMLEWYEKGVPNARVMGRRGTGQQRQNDGGEDVTQRLEEYFNTNGDINDFQ